MATWLVDVTFVHKRPTRTRTDRDPNWPGPATLAKLVGVSMNEGSTATRTTFYLHVDADDAFTALELSRPVWTRRAEWVDLTGEPDDIHVSRAGSILAA